MVSFDYFRKQDYIFSPRTPANALKALFEGLLPPEAFINKATSVLPISQPPIKLLEIERILARPELDLDTSLLIIEILEKLIEDPDPEIALFAAESINAMESKYNTKIEKLRKEIKENGLPEDKKQTMSFTLAELFYELAMINRTRPTLKNFYLKEAYYYLKEKQHVSQEESELIISILQELGLYGQAEKIIVSSQEEFGAAQFYILEAQNLYLSGNVHRIHLVLEKIKTLKQDLSEEQQNLISFWESV